MGESVPAQLTHEEPDRREHLIGDIARIDPVEGLAIDRLVHEDVAVRLRRRDRPQVRRPHADGPCRERDERFVLDGAPQRQERSFVAEVAGEEAAVEAEQQIGAALVRAERLEEQLGAVGLDAEVGRRPAASTDARSSWRMGTPTAETPSMTACMLGRREGAPVATSTAAPASHPTATASIASNDAGESTKAVTIRPTISAHPTRRAERPSQGAAAVSAPGNRRDAGGRREPCSRQGTELDAEIDEHLPLIGLDRGLERRDERDRQQPAEGDRAEHPPPSPVERPREQTPEHDDGQDPCPDHDDVDQPRRNGVEPTEEIRPNPTRAFPNRRSTMRRMSTQPAAMTRRKRSAGERSISWRELTMLLPPHRGVGGSRRSRAPSGQRLGLGLSELGLVDHALGVEVGEPGDLVGGATAATGRHGLDVLTEGGVLSLRGLRRMFLHLVAPGDEVHEHAEVGHEDDEDRPQRLAPPDRSGLRKMSPNTVINSQIQMKNRKNHSIDQNTWPVPNSASSMTHSSIKRHGWRLR